MPQSPSAGAQTLARGLQTLRSVALSADGLTLQEITERQGIHRTVAYRILGTLTAEGLIHKGHDGRYRGATGLLTLAPAGHAALRSAAMEPLQQAADRLGATTALLINEGGEAVALAVVPPRAPRYHIAFSEGSRHPLDRGSAGLALRALRPPTNEDAEDVRDARAAGHARTFGQVEPGMHGLATPVRIGSTDACVNLITHRDDHLDAAVPVLRETADAIAAAVAEN